MPSRRLSLVIDFDGTITKKDTIGALAKAAQQFQARSGVQPNPAWPAIVQAYIQDHDQYKASYEPKAEKRRALLDELEYLRGMKSVEQRSLSRVEASGLFRGMDKDKLFAAGRQATMDGSVQVRDGFPALLSLASQNGWPVSILSVNWSSSFIRGVLDDRSMAQVIANEIQTDGTISGPEVLEGICQKDPLMTCEDKYRALLALYQQQGESLEDLVYFGDSTSDIECLLASRGVAVAETAEKSSLIQTLERVGFVVPLADDELSAGAKLAWCNSFQDVIGSGFLTLDMLGKA